MALGTISRLFEADILVIGVQFILAPRAFGSSSGATWSNFGRTEYSYRKPAVTEYSTTHSYGNIVNSSSCQPTVRFEGALVYEQAYRPTPCTIPVDSWHHV
jgi:hypothetical protein